MRNRIVENCEDGSGMAAAFTLDNFHGSLSKSLFNTTL